ncbi:MAG: TetR/AcrR family transcriptional regulator [Terracidiphilus sp.]|jgi:TetR/AcrR family transcriptional repressor of nem operon
MNSTLPTHESKTKILDAALHVIRAKGYSATRIEDICEAASLTKGSFFHHFKSKEDLALAAAEYWTFRTAALFAASPYNDASAIPDPVDRLLAYIDLRKALIKGDLPDFTCLVGTMVQEVYGTHPQLCKACCHSIAGHAATLIPDIEAAMRQRGLKQGKHARFTPESLALYTQATIQGAFVLAKAKQNAATAIDCIDHLHRYFELLFNQPNSVREVA